MKSLSDRDAFQTARPGPTREVIARLARLIWEKEGRTEDFGVKFNLKAKALLAEKDRSNNHEIRF